MLLCSASDHQVTTVLIPMLCPPSDHQVTTVLIPMLLCSPSDHQVTTVLIPMLCSPSDHPVTTVLIPMLCSPSDHQVTGEDRKIPLLRDVFEAFPNVPINVDVKVNNDRLIAKVCHLPAEAVTQL